MQISICHNRTSKTSEKRSWDNVFMAKMNFKRDFALAGEISMIINLQFRQYILFEHDDLISCKYFVTFYEDFE